ncbi:MAG: hypothetical protein HXS54_06300 [Theionarchaea archaeon]|nr:hypothetical protein [Theionarchaea archaeon]DBA34870.1 TPA_asm: hypothetical protein vir521_00076 [Caudoviricetes sp. vir521]
MKTLYLTVSPLAKRRFDLLQQWLFQIENENLKEDETFKRINQNETFEFAMLIADKYLQEEREKNEQAKEQG